MELIFQVVSSFVLVCGFLFAFFVGGFGLMNFKNSNSVVLGVMGSCVWLVFMASHILVLYLLWFLDNISFLWLIIPAVFQVVYFWTVGGNVSAR